MKKTILAIAVATIALAPALAEAKSRGGGSSFRSSPSISRSVTRVPSVPKVTTPKVTAPKVTTPKTKATKTVPTVTRKTVTTKRPTSHSKPVPSTNIFWYIIGFEFLDEWFEEEEEVQEDEGGWLW